MSVKRLLSQETIENLPRKPTSETWRWSRAAVIAISRSNRLFVRGVLLRFLFSAGPKVLSNAKFQKMVMRVTN
jgi:hypothetical protein